MENSDVYLILYARIYVCLYLSIISHIRDELYDLPYKDYISAFCIMLMCYYIDKIPIKNRSKPNKV